MGYASEVPDATFAVYGLTDETLDGWDDERSAGTMPRPTCPAEPPSTRRRSSGSGRSRSSRASSSGTRSIEGEALVDFLNRDTNGLATFILVRETQGSGRSDLVHGFANNNHPDLPPPTLRLTVAPRVR